MKTNTSEKELMGMVSHMLKNENELPMLKFSYECMMEDIYGNLTHMEDGTYEFRLGASIYEEILYILSFVNKTKTKTIIIVLSLDILMKLIVKKFILL